jgi:hypothetical protein
VPAFGDVFKELAKARSAGNGKSEPNRPDR